MVSNYKFSELQSLFVIPDGVWTKPCPSCNCKGLHYDCDCDRVICHVCGFEARCKHG